MYKQLSILLLTTLLCASPAGSACTYYENMFGIIGEVTPPVNASGDPIGFTDIIVEDEELLRKVGESSFGVEHDTLSFGTRN